MTHPDPNVILNELYCFDLWNKAQRRALSALYNNFCLDTTLYDKVNFWKQYFPNVPCTFSPDGDEWKYYEKDISYLILMEYHWLGQNNLI